MEPVVAGYRIWPWVFNLADAWLVIGVGLLLLNFWWDRRQEKAAERAAAAASASADEPTDG
jgi:lipoprotein signal peptidase